MIRILNEMIKRKVIVFILLALWVFAGIYSYYIIPKQENPDTSLPGAIITTVYPGATSQEVEKMVTTKIEDAVNEVGSIQTLDSISMNSASVVVVLFDTDANGTEVLSLLRQKIDDIQSSLPDMVYESEINTELSTSPQFIIALSGQDYSQEDLVTYAETIKEAILDVNGVERVDIEGQLEKQVNVVVDIDALNLYNISIENIVNLMKAQNLSIPSGSIQYESGIINVNTPSTFSSLKDIENIVVAGSEEDTIGFVQLKDIAEVSIDYASGYSYMQDGVNAILLTGYFEDSVNDVLIGNDVRKIIDQQALQLPPNIDYHEVVYSSEDIDKSVTDFILNLLESMALIIVVVMIGVKLKNAIVVSIALPLSIFATFIVMYLLGIEFHFISIMALIVSLGILVDNAIVVSDAIQQKLNEELSKKEAIESAIKETAAPVFTSTLTTIITFGILLFIPGAVGTIVATIPIVVITSLIASYFVAMFIVPLFAYLSFSKEAEHKIEKNKTSLKSLFNKALELSLKYKKSTIVIAFSTLIVAVFLVFSLGLTFFPYSDKPIVYINIKSERMNIDKTQEIVDEIQSILADEPLVEHVLSSVGKGLPRFFLTVPTLTESSDTAQIMIELDENSDAFIDNFDFGSKLQDKLNQSIVGAKVEVKYLEISMPTDAKVAIEIYGDDLDVLRDFSETSQDILKDIDGTTNVRDDAVGYTYEYTVDIDSDIVNLMGVLKYDVVKQINTALMGAETSNYVVGGNEMPIIVKSNVQNLDDLYRLPINSSVTDTQITLSQIATINLGTSIPIIQRTDRQRSITIMSDLKSGYKSSDVEASYKAAIESIIPDGVSVKFNGEMTQMMTLIGNLAVAGGISIILIYIVLLLQFDKLLKPLIILVSIPLSFIGSFLGLYIFNIDLQAMALLGLVSLIGIVVNNGIILVEVMDTQIKLGYSVYDACVSAVDKRYRAITLSTITTCIGLVPLIMSKDPLSAPMALVLLFGLLFSTILTMVVVPVLYSMVVVDPNDISSYHKLQLIQLAKSYDLELPQKKSNKNLRELIQAYLDQKKGNQDGSTS